MAPAPLSQANGMLNDDLLPSTEVGAELMRPPLTDLEPMSGRKIRDVAVQDLLYEEELLRNPFSLKMW